MAMYRYQTQPGRQSGVGEHLEGGTLVLQQGIRYPE
jgi:hypothetical protein